MKRIYVIKRDGRKVLFDHMKIVDAILAAFRELDGEESEYALIKAGNIADYIAEYAEGAKHELTIEEIQDLVEHGLMSLKRKDVARAYISYRDERTKARGNSIDKTVEEYLSGNNIYWNTENSNKDAKVVTTQRDYLAGIYSTDYARKKLLPKEVSNAHDLGIIHEHDMDYLAQNALNNCSLINLDDCLQNGTVINGVRIDKPHRLITATTIATQIITAVASSEYGGCTITLTHLAPFVKASYNRYLTEVTKELETVEFFDDCKANHKIIEKIAKDRLQKEISDAVQTFNYQVNSMSTTNGQAPFLSVMMYLNENTEYTEEVAMLTEEFLKQRILGMKNEKGVYVTQEFPKLLYTLDENNIHKDSEYYYLTQLAAKCTAKRMVPDYISAKQMKRLKGDVYPCMGCRSFLTPDRTTKNYAKALNYDKNANKYYGRFNVGVTTINLVDLALSANKDFDLFWKLFEERTELCHQGLKVRIKRLEGVTSDVAPILWQHGAFARLDKGESLYDLIHNGYATASLGYAGLYECVKVMTGKSHMDHGEGEQFGLEVMQALNDRCNEWKAAENIDYSLYGSPIESTTYKFAKCLKKRFGDDVFFKLDGEDRNYITNSYHCPVWTKISPFEKLETEAKFQELSPGGAISYIECANLTDNIDAVVQTLQFIYENIMYAELNTKSDYCQECGYEGEILIDDNNEWYCPQCGNRNHDTLNVARRTCGYIGSHFWNFGRTDEIKHRYVHLGGE